jgi:hypothetical protein
VIDVKSAEVETSELVARRIRRALEYVPAERLVINPDCGLRHLPAEVVRAKLRAMVAGTEQVRSEIAAGEPQEESRGHKTRPARQASAGRAAPNGRVAAGAGDNAKQRA